MSYKVEITKSHEFTREDINDLVCTALEGGINDWCGKIEIVLNDDKTYSGVAPDDQTNVQYASDVIGYGGKLKLRYIDDRTEIWVLDLPKMLKGIKMHCENSNISPDILMVNYDAVDADSIVQYALFDEIVYS